MVSNMQLLAIATCDDVHLSVKVDTLLMMETISFKVIQKGGTLKRPARCCCLTLKRSSICRSASEVSLRLLL